MSGIILATRFSVAVSFLFELYVGLLGLKHDNAMRSADFCYYHNEFRGDLFH